MESQRWRRRQLLDLPRRAAKRRRGSGQNHRHTVSQNYSQGIYSSTATGRYRPGACLVKSNPQLIRKWRWSHPYVLSRSPTAPPGSLTPTWWRKPWNRKPVLSVIPVETQGSSGVENRLSSEEIAAADYVILATGRGLSGDDRARFAGKKVYEIAISQALKNIDQIFSELPTNSQLFAADSGVKLGKQEVQSGSVMSHLMAGVSAALPFVIGGGILVALANMLVQFGLPYTDMSKGAPSFTWVVESIGYLGFTFMIPIMGAYIASSIADKPAFAPAFLVCYLANDKALLGTQSGAGFLGAVVLGLAIGYFVFWFRKVRLGKALQPLLGSMLIPFVTLLVFGVLTYYVIGPVMSDLMGGLLHFLNTIPPSMKFAAAFLVGAMLAFDMGGPINKTAWFFCFSLLEKHIYDWYAIVGVVALMPPVAAGLATFIAPKLFTRQEKEAASSAIVVGATVATEPAIPYALAAPLPMITANTLAGGITGVLVIAFGIKRLAPGLGIFDPLIGLMSPVGSFYLVLAIGLALNISFIIVLKGLWLRRKAKAAQQELVHEH
ncbi:fused predicted PTS enzymes: IIB component/IIC component [Escherichia coli K-12]|nr:fused predicted PTS enzymes: IIB component/IIC component [Escherichia coli K-12]